MDRLRTTPLRVFLAALLGWAVPAVLMGCLVLFDDNPAEEFGRVRGFIVGLAVLALGPLILPGIPAWIVCHRLRARARTAALCGAAAGVLAALGLGLLIWLSNRTWGPLDTIVLGLFSLCGGGVGALTCFLMWKIAYPRALQTSAADVF